MLAFRLTASLLIGLLLGAALTPRGLGAQRREPPAASSGQPPVSMTCPMHPDVVESVPGSCPICKMNLIPVRLEAIWTCPVHSIVHESGAGACPICRRPLIQMTVALTWTCADHPEIDQIDRGTCPDGKGMIAKRTLRPHGNHNPQHGGQFFMAPDNTHHLEGAYPRARVFRLYLYDDYARPLPSDQIKRVKARVVTKETFDSGTRATTEVAAFPLAMARGATYLEARVDDSSLPAQMTAKVRFKDDSPEYRFDFTFSALSKEPVLPSTPASTTVNGKPSRPARSPAASTGSTSEPTAAPIAPGSSAPSPADAGAPTADPVQISLPIPDTTEGILAQLNSSSEQIRDLVQRGDFGGVWVPAFQARDLAIALEGRLSQLGPVNREAAEPAIKRLVRTAWLLDAFGDVGNRQQIVDAYSIFASAVAELASAFAPRP